MRVKGIVTTFALAVALAAGPGLAEAPRVATDIPPVHSLVARVMQGVGEPALILPPGASPHGHAMRPSEAAALADADLVVWMGEGLTPWLARGIDALASGAASVELLEAAGASLLGYREGATFERHEHGEAEHGGAEQDGAGHDGAGHDEAGHDEAGHAGPADLHAAGGGHAEEDRGAGRDAPARAHGVDPHAWLDPENAKLWLEAIAAALADADPGNAGAYTRNAAEGRAELDALMAELAETVGPVRGRPFVVFHDAYQYFERRFGLEAAGAISLADAAPPSPARLYEVRRAVRETGARCVFAEPQFAPGLIETVVEGTSARAATLDPLGASLAPGPDLYPELMRGLTADLRDCLGEAP